MRNKVPVLRTYAEIAPYLPHPIPRRQWIRLADYGKAPPYTRPAGLKSEPLFEENSVIEYIKDRYQKLLPQYCALLDKEGLSGNVTPPFRGERL